MFHELHLSRAHTRTMLYINFVSQVTINVVTVVDNVLEVGNGVYVESVDDAAPTRILDALEGQVSLFQLQGEGDNLTAIGRSVGVVALRIPESSLDDGLGFATLTSADEVNLYDDLSENTTAVFTDIVDIPDEMIEASVLLPPDITSHLSPNATSKCLWSIKHATH